MTKKSLKKTKKILLAFLFILSTFSIYLQSAPARRNKSSTKKIRVLIKEHNATKESKLFIKSDSGFVLESPTNSHVTGFHNSKEVRILCRNKILYFKCRDQKYRRIKNVSIQIANPTNTFTFAGKTYQGSLIIRVDRRKNKVMVINKLPLEDYIYSVVRYESIPSWPLEMQKLQAIISRTYAVFLMQQARQNSSHNRHFDVRNTNFHQVYNGTHGCTHLRQAVKQTQNVIVTYKGKIALTMFDSCCGGIIPAHMRFREANKPYLCRTRQCTFCQKSRLYRWKRDMHVNTFLKTLKNHPRFRRRFQGFGDKLTNIRIINSDKAGIVHRIKLVGRRSKQQVTLTGKELKNALRRRIRSLSVSIKKIRDRILITGKG